MTESRKPSSDQSREARLAAALRSNLARRKQQARARAAGSGQAKGTDRAQNPDAPQQPGAKPADSKQANGPEQPTESED